MWSLGLKGRCRENLAQLKSISLLSFKSYSSSASDATSNLIILNPREAGLVKLKPRRPKQKIFKGNQQLQIPNITPLDTISRTSGPSETIVSAIHSQRPESSNVTQLRFEQIRDELARGFKKSHLQDYLKAQKVHPRLYARLTKPKLAQLIMTGVWNCAVRIDEHQSGGGIFVENFLELNEMEFVLVLGRNGRLLREWSKSGARISISPTRNQIIVHSTQETFDWINASLSSFLETTIATEVDVSELKRLVDTEMFLEHLATIQRLTDTYFRDASGNDVFGDSIIVYSAGDGKYTSTNLVKRLLVQLIQPALTKSWKPDEWWFDISSENLSKTLFHPFSDTDSLEWMERMRDWYRWETVKTKGIGGNPSKQKLELRCLNSPEFSELPNSGIINFTDSTEGQLEQIIRELVASHIVPKALNGETVSATLTMTPGYVLNQTKRDTIVPNAGMQKTFSSNIPFVSNLSSTLPLFNKDIQHEDYTATTSNENEVSEDIVKSQYNNISAGDWSDILKLNSVTDEDGEKVFTARRKDMDLSSNLRLVQMKFVANPYQGLSMNYPPIEAWAELPPLNLSSNSLLQQVPRIVAVPLEASANISLPNSKADLRATLAYTYPIEKTPEIENYFLKKCRFGRIGPIEIAPELTIEINGQKVSYLYSSAAYVTLADLEYRHNLLQFSQIEGGKLGGRKIEASIIEHIEDAKELNIADAAPKLVQNILGFTQLL